MNRAMNRAKMFERERDRCIMGSLHDLITKAFQDQDSFQTFLDMNSTGIVREGGQSTQEVMYTRI